MHTPPANAMLRKRIEERRLGGLNAGPVANVIFEARRYYFLSSRESSSSEQFRKQYLTHSKLAK